ncbi:hypothetical protein Bbelb_345340 [Branchiostoma belcheri]|nr:hypothetical protein Bbelb_345340 [Branchiostoma belcheri]
MGQSESLSVSPEGQHDESYGYEVMTVEEINKRQLGKLIIKYCGHEGTTDNEQTASIRKLLQRAITNLEPQQEQYPGVWRDAELKFFDLYGKGYLVKSGEGSVKFVAQITGKGDVELSKIKDESFFASLKALLVTRPAPQPQMEGAPPAQSNAGQRFLSFLTSPFSSGPSQAEGSSQNFSASADGTPYGQHQGLSGYGQGNGSQNHASNSFNLNNPQPVDDLPGSESETGSDESGCASQDQLQPTGDLNARRYSDPSTVLRPGYRKAGTKVIQYWLPSSEVIQYWKAECRCT